MTRKSIENQITREAADRELQGLDINNDELDLLCLGFLQGHAGTSFGLLELADHLGLSENAAYRILYKHRNKVRGGAMLDQNSGGKSGKVRLYYSDMPDLPPSREGLKILQRRQRFLELKPEDQAVIERDYLNRQDARDDMAWRIRHFGRRPEVSAAGYNGVIRIRTAEDQEKFNQRFGRRSVKGGTVNKKR